MTSKGICSPRLWDIEHRREQGPWNDPRRWSKSPLFLTSTYGHDETKPLSSLPPLLSWPMQDRPPHPCIQKSLSFLSNGRLVILTQSSFPVDTAASQTLSYQNLNLQPAPLKCPRRNAGFLSHPPSYHSTTPYPLSLTARLCCLVTVILHLTWGLLANSTIIFLRENKQEKLPHTVLCLNLTGTLFIKWLFFYTKVLIESSFLFCLPTCQIR